MEIAVSAPKGFRDRPRAQAGVLAAYCVLLALTLVLDWRARSDVAVGALLAISIAIVAWWTTGRSLALMVLLTLLARGLAAAMGWVGAAVALQQAVAVIAMAFLAHYAAHEFATALAALHELRPRVERVEERLKALDGHGD